jgi:hypothetical protein
LSARGAAEISPFHLPQDQIAKELDRRPTFLTIQAPTIAEIFSDRLFAAAAESAVA